MTIEFLGKRVSGPFTIPSGIVATAVPIIRELWRRVPQLGVMTTKSIGPEPRSGYREPVYTQYAPGSYANAVGLTNPGAEAAAHSFAELEIPADRSLVISIFGGNVEEFVRVAQTLAPFADALELNLSCPHAQGYGMAMGQDPEMVRTITAAVKAAVHVPVIPKLTPNVQDIAAIARAAVDGGADALCAINTVGPGYVSAHGEPVLSNGVGGLSGKGILPLGLKCVADTVAAVDVPVIGCGGASSADDVRAYVAAGAKIVGIGSALTGLTTDGIVDYFATLAQDLDRGSNDAEHNVRYDVDMAFRPVTLVENVRVTDDIALLRFDRAVSLRAGEFVFVWIPGVGEKPFSALVDDPFTLAVIDVGEFTSKLVRAAPGLVAYVRGPYGQPVAPPDDSRIVAVAGGTGLAAVYQIARDFGNAHIFMGARSAERLYFARECADVASLHIATDDGSEGYHGLVTELLRADLEKRSADELAHTVFYNCGPAPMVAAVERVQREFVGAGRIHSAIDYLTKCGVGVCGACFAPDGRRLCVDGPFLGG